MGMLVEKINEVKEESSYLLSLSSQHISYREKREKLPMVSSVTFKHVLLNLGFPKLLFPGSS